MPEDHDQSLDASRVLAVIWAVAEVRAFSAHP